MSLNNDIEMFTYNAFIPITVSVLGEGLKYTFLLQETQLAHREHTSCLVSKLNVLFSLFNVIMIDAEILRVDGLYKIIQTQLFYSF